MKDSHFQNNSLRHNLYKVTPAVLWGANNGFCVYVFQCDCAGVSSFYKMPLFMSVSVCFIPFAKLHVPVKIVISDFDIYCCDSLL